MSCSMLIVKAFLRWFFRWQSRWIICRLSRVYEKHKIWTFPFPWYFVLYLQVGSCRPYGKSLFLTTEFSSMIANICKNIIRIYILPFPLGVVLFPKCWAAAVATRRIWSQGVIKAACSKFILLMHCNSKCVCVCVSACMHLCERLCMCACEWVSELGWAKKFGAWPWPLN